MPAPLWQAGALQSAQVNAIALTADAVLAVTKTLYPGSLEPRWRIAVLDRDNGALVWQHGLPSAACENGLAVDREGRVLVAMADGSVACFGGGAAFSAYIDRLMALGRSGEDRDLAIQRLKQALTMTRDPDDRDNLISCLGELGIDMCRPALEKGFICTWQLLGPVPWNMADYAIDKVLVGEPDVTLDKPCQVAGKTLAWQRHVTVHPTGMIDMAAHFGPHNSHAAYAYAEVVLPEAQNLVLKLGSNDGFKCWFNGVEAGRFDGGRTYHVDENTLRVQGLEGKNAILVKVTQMGGGWGLSVRVADPAGSPISQAD